MATDISELMLRDFAMVPPDASVQEVAQAMAETECRIVVVGRDGAIAGVLTEHDVLIRVVAAGLDPGRTRVAEVMSAELFTCLEDQSQEEAAAAMAEHRINQLPVLDREGRVVGLLTYLATRAGAGEEESRDTCGLKQSAGGAEPAD